VRRVGQLARWARDRGGRGPASDRQQGTVPAAHAPAFSGPALNLRSPAHRTERELLKLALQYPELVSPAFDAYGADEFTAPPYAAVRMAVEEAGGAELGAKDAQAYLARVREAAPDDVVRAMVTELAVEAVLSRNVDDLYAGNQLVQVRLRAVDRRIRDIHGTVARLSSGGDPARLAAAQNELWVLQQYAQALREQGADAL
jgi:DNA primase